MNLGEQNMIDTPVGPYVLEMPKNIGPSPKKFSIAILGGYGHFGGRIARMLSSDPKLALFVAGRHMSKSVSKCAELYMNDAKSLLFPLELDYTARDFPVELKRFGIELVINASGPYQKQDYQVARACLLAGAHYIDLADSREFVTGIERLDAQARKENLLIVSGASTLPGLSSAVVDEYCYRFQELRSIRISIAPGQNTPRGMATLEAVMSYCGRPIRIWEDRCWTTAYGWQDLRRNHYPELGTRWLSRCDVPDLELFPQRYPSVRTVRFDAALELTPVHWGFWCLAWLVRSGIISRPERLAPALHRIGRWFDRFGSDVGGMHVELAGIGHNEKPLQLDWHLVARQGHGPEIPAIPAVILARELATGKFTIRGAYPCMSLITLEQFTHAAIHLDIKWKVTETRP